MAKKCTKKRDARAKFYFCSIAFLPFSLPSPSSLLKLPNTTINQKQSISTKQTRGIHVKDNKEARIRIKLVGVRRNAT